MATLTVLDVIAVALSSGVVSAAGTQLLGDWQANRRQRREQAFQRSLQENERRHQERLRVEAAHAEARSTFLEDTARAVEWLNHEWGIHHGLDADWVPDHDPTPDFSSVGEVIKALRRLELQHPTRNVRNLATKLRGNISGHYGSIRTIWNQDVEEVEQITGDVPDPERFAQWVREGEALLEAMHEPADALQSARLKTT